MPDPFVETEATSPSEIARQEEPTDEALESIKAEEPIELAVTDDGPDHVLVEGERLSRDVYRQRQIDELASRTVFNRAAVPGVEGQTEPDR